MALHHQLEDECRAQSNTCSAGRVQCGVPACGKSLTNLTRVYDPVRASSPLAAENGANLPLTRRVTAYLCWLLGNAVPPLNEVLFPLEVIELRMVCAITVCQDT